MLSSADSHSRFAQNLREGMSMNVAPPRSNNMQQSVPTAPQRNTLFSQQQNNPQSLDSIDQLANAMLTQNLVPTLQAEPAPPNFFHRRQPSGINQLQPQKQQVTPPFNLSESPTSFLHL
jgi:ATP-dependent DNA helicase HFM1/MER3